MDKKENTSLQIDEIDDKLIFPTNRRNLLNIISSGVLGPKEVYSKYRKDILDVTKGYLPLFNGSISKEIIELTTSNPEVNYPVLIELDMKKMLTKVMRSVPSMEDVIKLTDSILSFDMIDTIHFFSEKEKEDFTSKTFQNVPIDIYKLEVSPELFESGLIVDVSCFDSIDGVFEDTDILRRKSQIADKVTASIALLSKNMKRSDDVILLRALIEFNTIPEETVVSKEYDVLVELINSSIIADNGLSKDDDENVKLMGLLLDILIETDPSNGWEPVEVLDRLHIDYIKLSGNDSDNVLKWHTFCKAVLKNEKNINPDAFSDEHDTVKRAIFLFLLRPEYEDIINATHESYLNPGYIVRVLALFLAGFRVGYERLSNEFKTPKEYHELFSILKSYIINKSMGHDIDDIVIETALDITCDVKDKEYLCKLDISHRTLIEQSIQLPRNVHEIIKMMKEQHYEQTKYSVFDNRISYSFEYVVEKRGQPIYIDVERHVIKISSPCVEFTKYRSYEKKFATNKVLAQMMKDNAAMNGKAYFVYEEGVQLSLERRIAISNIDNVEIINIIEFVAKTADEFEKVYFKQDRVQ